MEPNSLGRKLGVGLRVAGRIARARAAEAARTSDGAAASAPGQRSPGVQPMTQPAAEPAQRGLKAEKSVGGNLARGLGKGTRNFADSFFSPLAHAGGVLWLEITGCFFALFALFFAQNVYELRARYAPGPLHRKFELYCVLTLLFVYFSASSFLQARRKARRQRARG